MPSFRLVTFAVSILAFGNVLAQDDTLLWSSYIGGSDWDFVRDVAVLPDGNIAIVGETRSTDFPITSNAFDHTHGNPASFDGFFAICDPTGSELLYSTYIGGSGEEVDLELCQMTDGRILIGGSTGSLDFPVYGNAYQIEPAGSHDLFLVLFDVNTMSVVWSTYYGSATNEALRCLRTTSDGDIVVGYSYWSGGRVDLAICRLSYPNTAEIWSYIFPIWGNNFGIDVDDAGDVYVAGTTDATFPATPGAYDTEINGPTDSFAMKVSGADGSIIWGTYLNSFEAGGIDSHIIVNGEGNVVVCGTNRGTDFPTVEPYIASEIEGVFICTLSADGSTLERSTMVYGGVAWDFELDDSGNPLVAMQTHASGIDVPPGAVDPSYNGEGDGLVVKAYDNLSTVIYTTYFGGNLFDSANAITAAGDGVIVVGGYTESCEDFPVTPGAFDEELSLPIFKGYVCMIRTTDPKPSIVDVPNDQGGALSVSFNAFPFLPIESPVEIERYVVETYTIDGDITNVLCFGLEVANETTWQPGRARAAPTQSHPTPARRSATG